MTKRASQTQYDLDDSLLIAGQLMGLSYKLNVRALEKFLASPPKDFRSFRYAKEIRAAIKFRKAVHG